MAQVSRRKVSGEVWVQVWDGLLEAVEKSDSKVMVESLLGGLLTSTEKVMLAKRFMVGVLVVSEWSAYEIAGVLKLSLPTVYKMMALLELDPSYRGVLERIMNEKIKRPKDFSLRKKGMVIEMVEELGVEIGHIFSKPRHRS